MYAHASASFLQYIVMATIFSRIVAGEIPCYKVAENDKFFAFLDINPLVKGHTLVIPKQEVDYIFDLSDEDLAAMHSGSSPCTHPSDTDAERERHAFFQSEAATIRCRV